MTPPLRPDVEKEVGELLCGVNAVDNLAKDVLDLLDENSSAKHPGAATMDQGLRDAIRMKMAHVLTVTARVLPG